MRKPDPRHLLETIARAGGVPERAVLVGDTVTDRDAARGGGGALRAGRLRARRARRSRALEPEAVLAHYDELPEVLERLVPRALARMSGAGEPNRLGMRQAGP